MDKEIWQQYFPETTPKAQDPRLKLCHSLLERCFCTAAELVLECARQGDQWVLWLDYHRLEELEIASLAGMLKTEPDVGLKCLAVAAHQGCVQAGVHVPERVCVRLFNFGSPISFQSIKAGLLGKLVALKGIVVRMGSVKDVIGSMACVCVKCGLHMKKNINLASNITNGVCERPQCNSKSIHPEMDSVQLNGWQKIQLQEQLPIEKQVMNCLNIQCVTENLVSRQRAVFPWLLMLC